MKNISLIIFAVLFTVLSSCTKKNEIEYVNNNQEQLSENNVYNNKEDPGGQELEELRIWYDIHTNEWWWFCAPPPENCLKEAVIEGNSGESKDEQYAVYEMFLDAIEKNSINEFFKGSNWLVLFPQLLEADMNSFLLMLQNDNDLKIVEKYNFKEGTYHYFYIGLPLDADEENIDLNKVKIALRVKI